MRGTAVLVWMVLVFLLAAVWEYLSAPGADEGGARWVVAVGFALAMLVWTKAWFKGMRIVGERTRTVRQADELVAMNEPLRAVAALEPLLARRRVRGTPRYLGLMSLGGAREALGEFEAAAEAYTSAEVALGKLGGMYAEQHIAVTRAHRAFVLAALGRLEQAESALAIVPPAAALPGTALAQARARALVLVKRGEDRQVIETIEAVRHQIQVASPLRTQRTFELLERLATSRLQPASRSGSAWRAPTSSGLRDWLIKLLPEASPLLGGP